MQHPNDGFGQRFAAQNPNRGHFSKISCNWFPGEIDAKRPEAAADVSGNSRYVLRKASHALRSMSASLGAERIRRKLEEIERHNAKFDLEFFCRR